MEQAENALQNGQEPKTFSVKVWTDANGEPIMQTVSEEELVNGYLRQSDYTKKTQELAEERKVLDQKVAGAKAQGDRWEPGDEEAVDAYLQTKWYAKADYVEQLVEQKLKWVNKAQQDEQTLAGIIASNPDLKQFEWAIRKIAATDDSALEDIVVKYGFSTHDKLSKAKQRDIVGWTSKFESDKPKPYAEWSAEDKAKFKQQYWQQVFR